MKKLNSKGFTVTEIIVTLVLIGILTAIAVPMAASFVEYSRTVQHNNIARSIFVAVQSELSSKKNNGTLTDLSVFSYDGTSLDLVGGYLDGSSSLTSGQLSADLYPDLDAVNQDAMYYMILSKNGDDDEFLKELLDRVDLEREVLENSVCVELNAGTGSVTAVFYSDSLDSFAYTGNGENDLSQYRDSTSKRGVYLAAPTEMSFIVAEDPIIRLIDGTNNGGNIQNALYCEAYINNPDAQYTITLTNSEGDPITNSVGLPYALTFTQSSIVAFAPENALTVQYTDREADSHASSVGSTGHSVFTDTGRVDPDGGTAMTHYKVVWILDWLDTNDSEITFKNSIHVKYPDIGIDDIVAQLSITGSGVQFPSNTEHAYYSYALNGTYYLKDARHFSNMRYVAADPTTSLDRKFIQLDDIDFDPVKQFVPLNCVPVSGMIQERIFTATFSGVRSAQLSYKVDNVRITTNGTNGLTMASTGLFGTVTDSEITGICLDKAEISTSQGGNVGALAGRIERTKITRAAVNANVSVIESDDTDYVVVNAGGLVGTMKNSSIGSSYNSGSYSDSGYGTVTVSGTYNTAIHIGGIAGSIDAAASVVSSYNNARVGIKSAVKNDAKYLIENPVYAPLGYSSYKNISIGGVVGKNEGSVEKCYSTNFVGDHYDALLETVYFGTIVGNNVNRADSCFGMYNGLPYEMLGYNSGGEVVDTTEELRGALTKLGSAYIAGNLLASPSPEYYKPENYPYPVLRNNVQRFEWENIYSPTGFVLVGDVYFGDKSGDVLDRLHENYIKVDLADENAYNYIDNLCIDVWYKGHSPLYARVQLEIFTINRQHTGSYIETELNDLDYIRHSGAPQKDEAAWMSNFGNDESFYYTVPLRPNDDANYTVLPFVRGVLDSYAAGNDTDYIYLKVIASGVDPSEKSEHWKIDELPWR